VLGREVFLCKCSTDVAGGRDRDATGGGLRFVSGGEAHLCLLDKTSHGREHEIEFRARLARGEHWVLGLLGERVATYTWLHTRPRCAYPYLKSCAFSLPVPFGYGYDAWTSPELRGGGLRRQAFVHELRTLRSLGKDWEASFFVSYQLAGACRSLARAAIEIVPLWRIALGADRRLTIERLAATDRDASPEFTPDAE